MESSTNSLVVRTPTARFTSHQAHSRVATTMSNSAVVSTSSSSSPSSRHSHSRDSFGFSQTSPDNGDRSQRRRLHELFEQGVLTDVVLLVQGERVAAHRVVLATASPFFHALFTSGMKESHAQEIELHEMNAAALHELLTYMYLGELRINGDTILALIHTANQLEMLDVVELCCQQLMLELHVANCIDIFVCCDSLKSRAPCHALAHAALAMIEAFLDDVMETDAFLQLPLSLVDKILLRQRQAVGYEIALQAWVAVDPESRQPQIYQADGSPQATRGGLATLSDHEDDADDLEEDFFWGQSSTIVPSSLRKPVVFAIGGFNGPNALRSVEYLDFQSNEWFPVASMHDRRSYSGVAVTDDDKIIVMGGSCSARHLKSVELYDPELNVWTILPSMRKCRSYLGAALLDGYVYVVGGFNGISHLAAVERFDLEARCWEEVAPLNVGRSGLAVVVANGCLFAIGGYDGRRHLKSVEVFDPRHKHWTVLGATMRHARNGPAAVSLTKDNSILVFGGESQHGFRMNTSEKLDLHTDKWEDQDAFVDNRSGHVAVGMLRDSFVFAFGGSNKKDEYLDEVHRYDALTKQWMLHSRMVDQRCGLNVAVAKVSRDAACLQADPSFQLKRSLGNNSTTSNSTAFPRFLSDPRAPFA
jgi:hypothetical protein